MKESKLDGYKMNFDSIKITKEEKKYINTIILDVEQYNLLIELKAKIQEYLQNVDGKKEKIEKEIRNLKSILDTDMLELD
jgi:hypothetical protein